MALARLDCTIDVASLKGPRVIVLDRLLDAPPARQARWILSVAAVLVVLLAALGALIHPAISLVLLVGLSAGLLILSRIDLAFLGVVAVITLLPFAAIPLGVGFNPTFLDLTLGALYLIWAWRLATREQATLRWPPLSAGLLLLVGWMVVSLLAGLGQGMPSRNQLRVFGELILGAGLFLIVANLITDRASLRRVFLALVGLGAVAAAVGLVLYGLPDALEMRVLSSLRVVDYPTGSGVIRYVNDDPAGLQRATGTSIDPNSFGGLLAVMAALVAPQIVSRRPIVPRGLAIAAAALIAAAILLTVSRGSMLGLAAGLGVVGLARDRRLLAIAAAAGIFFLIVAGFLPWTAAYVANFTDGLRMEDQSTIMRLGEYKDAMILIRRYPLFGVGFGGVRDVDIYRGVSSLYLIVAESMGLIGLTIFVGVLGAAFARWTHAWRTMDADGMRAVVLGCMAAVTAAMVSGVFDHYFFTYPHAFALLWLIVGLGMGAVRLSGERQP